MPAQSGGSTSSADAAPSPPLDTPDQGVLAATATPAAQPTEPPPPTAITAVEPEPDIPVGTKEGDRVPDFALELVDGSTVTSTDLQAMDQPVFLFFTATF